jgi:hypothetical protein
MVEAAEVLGVSVEAIRKRVQRGTIRSDKGEDGRRYVYLDESPPESEVAGSSSPLLDALRDEIAHLRRESERKDAIIMSLSQSNAELSRTIRAIEAPSEPPRSPVERLEDEEMWREEAGMEARDPETRQAWHSQQYGAPRAETRSTAPQSPEELPEEASETSDTPEPRSGTGGDPGRASWWRRWFGA